MDGLHSFSSQQDQAEQQGNSSGELAVFLHRMASREFDNMNIKKKGQTTKDHDPG